MKVVVTGGSGQLGTVILRRLARDRAVKAIVSIDVRPPMVASAKLTAVHADVRDPDIGRHFEGADALMHLAFLVTQAAPRDTYFGINVEGSKNVFQAAARAGVARIVYASSVAAYGIAHGHVLPLAEDAPRKRVPEFAYSACKYDVEAYLDGFERDHPNIAICRIRPAILIGERMDHPLGQAAAAGFVLDPGAVPMPVVWDDDVAMVFALAVKQGARGAFNAGAEGLLSARDLARTAGLAHVTIPLAVLRQAARLPPLLGVGAAVDPAWLEAADIPIEVTSEKARRELDFQPTCPTARDVAEKLGRALRRRVDTRIAMFMKLSAIAASRAEPPVETLRDVTRIHLDLTGPGGADYAITVEGGRVAIARGIPRPPTSVVTMRATAFLDMLSGKTSPAAAQLLGTLRVDGEPTANMAIAGLVNMFRARGEQPGPAGWTVRRLSKWFSAPA